MDLAADPVGAAEDINGQLPSLEFVGRLPPAEVTGVEMEHGGDKNQAGHVRLEPAAICHVELDAAAGAPLPLVERRPEPARTEADPGQALGVQGPGQVLRVDERRT